MKTKYVFFGFCLAIASAFLVQGVRAENQTSATKQAAVDQKCQNLQTQIATRVARFDNNKVRHYNAYVNMKSRVGKFESKLALKGYDTTKLKNDQAELNTKILTFSNDYTTYINKLKEAQNYACGYSNGEFKAKMVEAKALLKIVKDDMMAIRNYYQTVVRPDITDLKNQKPAIN